MGLSVQFELKEAQQKTKEEMHKEIVTQKYVIIFYVRIIKTKMVL